MDSFYHNEDLPDYYWQGYHDLCQAIRKRDKHIVLHLLSQGVRVNKAYQNNLWRTPLHLSVISRCPDITKILLTKGADIGAKDINWDSPLTLAAKMENRNILDILLLADCLQNHENKDCFSHLHIACMVNKTDLVEKLVREDHAKNIDRAVGKHSMFWPGYTPLHFAVHYGCSETVEYLLTLGANMMAEDSRNLTPLHLAHLQENEKIVHQLLEAHKYEFKNPVNDQGLSHFHIACTRDDTSIVEHFLQLGVDVNRPVSAREKWPWHHFAPVHFAMYYNCPKVIKLLLEARVQLYSIFFFTLLNAAMREKNSIICNQLISRGPLVIKTHKPSEGILDIIHLASIQNDVTKMSRILSSGVCSLSSDFNAPSQLGSTPLHLAVKYNSEEMVKFLIDHEADILIQDINGETPLHIAFRSKSSNIFNLIVGCITSQNKNVSNHEKLSVFHILCSTNEIMAIKNFIQSGVDINEQVKNESSCWAGFSALHFACLFQQIEVMKILLDHNAEISINNVNNECPFDLVMMNFDTNLSSKQGEIFSFVIESISNHVIEDNNFRGISYLHALCMNRKTDLKVMKKYLLGHKKKIHELTNWPELRKYHKCTPLHLAVLFNNLAQAQLLLQEGANPFIFNDVGMTPLECLRSCMRPLTSDFPTLAQSCFTVGKFNQSLRPSHFHVACSLSLVSVVEYALNNARDEQTKMSLVNCLDIFGKTPLHTISVPFDKAVTPKITHLLLTSGADANARDYCLRTPLHSACRLNDFDVIKLIIDHGGDVNAQDIYGKTPFHCLRSVMLLDSIEEQVTLLLDNGTDVNLTNENGRTCLQIIMTEYWNAIKSRRPYGIFEDAVVICLKHIKRLQLIGSHISKGNLDAYLESLRYLNLNLIDGTFRPAFREAAFINDCRKEFELMETTPIDRYTTLRDVLSKNCNDMIFHCENPTLQQVVESPSFLQKYPIYGPLVKLQLKKGRIRRRLLIESMKSLTNLIGIQLPQSCLEAILQHLSDEELKTVIMSKGK